MVSCCSCEQYPSPWDPTCSRRQCLKDSADIAAPSAQENMGLFGDIQPAQRLVILVSSLTRLAGQSSVICAQHAYPHQIRQALAHAEHGPRAGQWAVGSHVDVLLRAPLPKPLISEMGVHLHLHGPGKPSNIEACHISVRDTRSFVAANLGCSRQCQCDKGETQRLECYRPLQCSLAEASSRAARAGSTSRQTKHAFLPGHGHTSAGHNRDATSASGGQQRAGWHPQHSLLILPNCWAQPGCRKKPAA